MATYCNDPIPFSVTTVILSRLPLKTLVKFRLACKLWESTICDRRFSYTSSVSRLLFSVCNRSDRTLTFLVSPPTEVLGHRFNLESLGKLELPDDYAFSMFQALHFRIGEVVDVQPIKYPVVESVHGLILVENEASVVVYNPSTRQTKSLPPADIPVVQRGSLWENQGAYGKTVLLHDPVSREYICLRFQRHHDRHFDGRIMGLEDDHWRTLPRPPAPVPWFGFHPTGAYLDGSLYLAALNMIQLVRFDLDSEKFEEIKPPSKLNSRVFMNLLFIYQGKVAMTSRLMEHAFDRCLFTLDDVSGKRWTRIAFVAVGDAETWRRLRQCEKRGITDDGEIILVNPDLRMRNEIYYYNPVSGNVRVLVAEVTGLAEDQFENQFGDRRPRALLHMDHVENLMLLK